MLRVEIWLSVSSDSSVYQRWLNISMPAFARITYGCSSMLHLICFSYMLSLHYRRFRILWMILIMQTVMSSKLCMCRGHKKLCLLYYMLHFLVSIWKRFFGTPTIWLASICLSLASSIFSYSFETWMVVEHGKVGRGVIYLGMIIGSIMYISLESNCLSFFSPLAAWSEARFAEWHVLVNDLLSICVLHRQPSGGKLSG